MNGVRRGRTGQGGQSGSEEGESSDHVDLGKMGWELVGGWDSKL